MANFSLLPILIAGLASALILAVQHYAVVPYWKAWRRTDLPLLARYALGVIGVLSPFSAILMCEGHWGLLVTLWGVVGISGLAVLFFYWLDAKAKQASLKRDAKKAK